MKTVCVLLLGWLLFDSEMTFKNILGMTLAVVGMVVYSWAVEADKKTATRVTAFQSQEEDTRPLKDQEDEHYGIRDVEVGKSHE